MNVATKFLALSHPAHGGHHAVTHHKGTNITALTLGHKLLNEHILFLALQQLNNRLGLFYGVGQQHANALGTLNELNHYRGTPYPLNGGQHVFLVPHEAGSGNTNIVATQNLQAAQLVPAIQNTVGGIGAKNAHLLKLPHYRCAVVGNRGAHPRQHRVVVA